MAPAYQNDLEKTAAIQIGRPVQSSLKHDGGGAIGVDLVSKDHTHVGRMKIILQALHRHGHAGKEEQTETARNNFQRDRPVSGTSQSHDNYCGET